MTHDSDVVSIIEAALDATPSCASCGTRTVIPSDEDGIVLERESAGRPRSRQGRLLQAVLPHERTVLLDGLAST